MNRFFTPVFLAFAALPVLCNGQLVTPKLRLPDTVRPTRYFADLHVTPGQHRFTGRIEIRLAILQPVSVIWLHAKSLEFEKASLRSNDVVLPVQLQNGNGDFVAITAASTIPAGTAVLTIGYSGEISRTLTDGAFEQRQGNDWYVFTKFEPVTARRVFPCFDEPSFKTPWNLTLHVPRELKAFSNTAIASEANEADGMKAERFEETRPLPSYLVAFAVGPFDIVETEPVGRNHRPSRIIVPHGRGAEAAYAASITPHLIDMLEQYFGTPYPYEKLDQIVVPITTAWGAMENAGLIAYGGFLLVPKEEDSELRQRTRAGAMEHEMSHQWFGDLVTMNWWDDIWLNEAFASWLSAKLLDEWKPEWQIKTDAARSLTVMHADSLTTARKIRQPIEAPGDIANAFDGITYGKGEAVIGMFENYVGPKKFQQAIRLYLHQHAWKNATSADLLAAIDKVAGPGKGAAFATFLNQAGFPRVTVSVECNGRTPKLHLEQQRFLPIGSPGTARAQWGVPVCTAWGNGNAAHRACVLLNKATGEFPLQGAHGCPSWVFADANAAGYYATVYEPSLTDKLLHSGMTELKADERAAALRNIQLLFSSGVGEPEQELRFVLEFSRSSDAGLVRQSAETIAGLSDLVPADRAASYAQLIQSLYGVRARQLGWKPQSGESLEIRLLRIAIVPLVATLGRDSALSSQADKLAREWLQDRHTLDPDLVAPVLSTAAWNGDRAFFEQLVDAVKSTRVLQERLWMITAMRNFRDPSIAQSALELLFGSGIDPRELQSLLQNAPQETRETVWDFVQQNFDRLNATLPGARGIPFGATLPLSAAGFCDARHEDEVKTFFESRIAELPGGARNLANTLERIQLCEARAAMVEPAVLDLLKSYHQTSNGNSDPLRLRSQ